MRSLMKKINFYNLLQLLLKAIMEPIPPLEKIQECFNHVNSIYHDWVETNLINQTASPPNMPMNKSPSGLVRVLIDQDDIYNEILQKLDAENDLKRLEWVLICYLTSLSEFNIPAQHNLNELIVTTLVSTAV